MVDSLWSSVMLFSFQFSISYRNHLKNVVKFLLRSVTKQIIATLHSLSLFLLTPAKVGVMSRGDTTRNKKRKPYGVRNWLPNINIIKGRTHRQRKRGDIA